jgi:hypothetical protein
MPDHVHMLLSIPPKYAVSQVVGVHEGEECDSHREALNKSSSRRKLKYNLLIFMDKMIREMKNFDLISISLAREFGERKRNFIANTRTTTALTNAGIPKSQWYGVNKTGQTAYTDPVKGPLPLMNWYVAN